MQEENLLPEQSLRIIQSMIGKTRAGLGENSHYFLLWGWLTFVGIITQYVLKVWMHVEQHYQVWWLTVLGLAGTLWLSSRQERTRKVRSYVDDGVKYLWIAVGITYFGLTLVLGLGEIGFEHCYTFYIMLYAVGTFITGSLIKFRPLVAGGSICWGLSVATVFTNFDGDLLLAALAILVSYIIPGHLLRLKKN